jgi:hypothetical protein
MKANRKTYYRVRSIISLLNPLLSVPEKFFKLKNNNYAQSVHQPIFIVGAPRSGSTIIYQSISNQFDVLYINNIVDLFYKNLWLGLSISKLLYQFRPHNCFKSIHGDTYMYSLNGPSESGSFWGRWFKKGQHYVDENELSRMQINELFTEINTVTNRFKKPLIIKNLANGQRLRQLKKVFPKAKIIYVKRDIFYNAQSIILAKDKLSLPRDKYWSIRTADYKKIKFMKWHLQVPSQIVSIQNQIESDIKLFDEHLTLDYDDFIKNFNVNIERIGQFIFHPYSTSLRANADQPTFKASDEIYLNSADEELLKEGINNVLSNN